MAEASAKATIVTGASSGIGRATARKLAADGFTVAALARRRDRLAEISGARVHGYPCDLAERAQIFDTVSRIDAELGRIDALANCAGAAFRAPLAEASEEQIRRLLELNLLGTLFMCQAVIPVMTRTGGAIVNVSSTIVNRPIPGTGVYGASKGAIEALTRQLAVELGPDNIRVSCVRPSLVRSEIWLAAGMPAEEYEKRLETMGRLYPAGRVGEPEDVAGLIAFLVSDKGAWMTGSTVTMDGGYSAGTVER